VSPNWIYFESPHRIRESLGVLEEWCLASERTPDFVFAKELTKIHETVHRGAGAPFLKQLQEQEFDPRGEWVFSITLSGDGEKNESRSEAWIQALECLLQAGISSKTASQVVASHFGIAKNLAYKKALSSQKK
jgi:16S rRNA (cytidine1402-2'-O)-methyltransferase